MKRNIIVIMLIGLMIAACDRDEFDDLDLPAANYQYIGINTQSATAVVAEGSQSANTLEIPLLYDVELASDFEITISTSGSAELGVDYVIADAVSTSGDSFTVRVPVDTAQSVFTIETVPNFETATSGNLNITFDITGLPEGVFTQAPVKSQFSVEILDDDCPFEATDFEGTASVTSNGGAAGTTEVSIVSETATTVTYEAEYGIAVFGNGFPFQFTVDYSDNTNITVDVPTQMFAGFGETWTITNVAGDLVNTCGKSITVTSSVSDTGTFGTFSVTDVYTLP